MSTDRIPAAAGGPLAEFAVAASDPVPAGGNLPIFLDDPGTAWYVEAGTLDVYAVAYRDGVPDSPFKHFVRAVEGRLVFGTGQLPDGNPLRLLAKGFPGSQLRRVSLSPLLDHLAEDAGTERLARAIADQADAWIDDVAGSVARDITPRSAADMAVAPSSQVNADGIVSAARQPVWVSADSLECAFFGLEEAEAPGPGLMAVTSESWITFPAPSDIACLSSADIDVSTLALRALPEFHRLALGVENLNRMALIADAANLQVAATRHRRTLEDRARSGLRALSSPSEGKAGDDGKADGDDGSLLRALRAVGRHEGLDIQAPPQQPHRAEASLDDILEASRVRARPVRLSAEDRWWHGDSGAMLAFHRDDGRPLALLPDLTGRYRVLDPATGRSRRANADIHGELQAEAWFLYRRMPVDRPVGMWDMLRVARANLAADILRVLATGLVASLLTLAPAAAVGVLIDSVIPSGSWGGLAHFTAVLVALAFGFALLHMLRGTALMRLEGRVAARLDAALWDRLLRLESRFFRRFTAGELAFRATTFHRLRDRLSGAAIETLLSTVFLLPSMALLFYYSAALAWVTLGVGGIAMAATATFGILQLGPQRRHVGCSRRLAGQLLQLIVGIRRLRASGAESAAFATWARIFREQKLAEIDTAILNEHLTAFSSAIPALATAVLFAVALSQGSTQLALADFLAVYAASIMFYSSIGMLGNSFSAIASVVPACEQTLPILEAAPEEAADDGVKLKLGGTIRFDRVSFRYSEDGPMVLSDVTIEARMGEFIAIVGESGAGKSTLVRLALGLEAPLSGAVYYDGQLLDHLDRRSVRKQVGVVLQEGDMLPGNVLTNIVGATERYTVAEAWRAAQRAAVDRDIASMPMGMYTPMSETAANFSGGQIQRIRIAAALVRNPRILFLDEATSWLDARTQEMTMKGITNSTSTRIVIAHRLSTVREANRIYVLKAGKVVQVGTFEELLETDGVFRDLALRQMV